MSALSWMSFGNSTHGPSDGMQVGVYFWLAAPRIRISPFYLRKSRIFSSNCRTRTTDEQLHPREVQRCMTRIELGKKWGDFVNLSMSLDQYPEIQSIPTVYYPPLQKLRAEFAEYIHRPFPMRHLARVFGLRPQWVDAFAARSAQWQLLLHDVANFRRALFYYSHHLLLHQ